MKRILWVQNPEEHKYMFSSFLDQFDEVILLTDYMVPDEETLRILKEEHWDPDIHARPVRELATEFKLSDDGKYEFPLECKVPMKVAKGKIDGNPYSFTKIKDLKVEPGAAYFCIGEAIWIYLRDLHSGHIGLRGTNESWQIYHLEPYTYQGAKFVFSEYIGDEHYLRHLDYFFDDSKLQDRIQPLKEERIINKLEDLLSELDYFHKSKEKTVIGFDYETNGLYKGDKYELLIPLGFGLADKDRGIYFELRDLTQEEMEKFKIAFKGFLDDRYEDLRVMNTSYETMMTRKFLGPGALYDFKDIDVWRVIYGDQIGYSMKWVPNMHFGRRASGPEMKRIKVPRDQYWTLKYTAQKYLRVGSWDDDFDFLVDSLHHLFEGYEIDNMDDFMTNALVQKLVTTTPLQVVDPGNWTALFLALRDKKKWNILSIRDLAIGAITPNLDPVSTGQWANYIVYYLKVLCLGISHINEVETHPAYIKICQQYPEYKEELDFRMREVDSEGNPKYFGNKFAVIPTQLLGKYCIYDSYYTAEIARFHLEEDKFTYTPEKSRDVGATWITTEKMEEIFSANKSLGAKLDLYGLYKSNTVRMNYLNKLFKSSVHANLLFALASFTQHELIAETSTPADPYDGLYSDPEMPVVFKTMSQYNMDPRDYNRLSKYLLPLVFDEYCEKKYNMERAKDLFGEELAENFYMTLIKFKPGGFTDSGCFSRSTNMHKEMGSYIRDLASITFEIHLYEKIEEYKSRGELYDFDEIRKAQIKVAKSNRISKQEFIDSIKSSNIYGMHLSDIISSVDVFEINHPDTKERVSMSFPEAFTWCKNNIYNIKADVDKTEGMISEYWKEYKLTIFMYHKLEYKDHIDSWGIFKEGMSIPERIRVFIDRMEGGISEYKDKYYPLMRAMVSEYLTKNNEGRSRDQQLTDVDGYYAYAMKYGYTEEQGLMKVDNYLEIKSTPALARAFIDSVTSCDMMKHVGISFKMAETYGFFKSINPEMIDLQGPWLIDEKHASGLAYKNWMQEVGALPMMYDNLRTGVFNSLESTEKINVLELSDDIYMLYPTIVHTFRFYRKMDKLRQYLEGQLVDADYKCLGVESDGIPLLDHLTPVQKHSNHAGDCVKMYPRYEIMMKFTKRNSSGRMAA